jgi:hypothetical protein
MLVAAGQQMSQDGASHVGKDFGNYRLADILGKGGSSVVYRAIHRSIESEVAIIVRIFQQREDYYREQKTLKTKYLQYGNDWLLLIQSIEAIPDGADRIDEQRRLARVLLDRIKSEEPRPGPATTAPPARKPGRRTGTGSGAGKKAAAPPV